MLKSMNLLKFSIQLEKMSIRSKHLLKQKAYVNGSWVTASNNKIFDVTNPADGSVVSQVPNMTVADVEVAIKGAYDAFQTWQHTTAKERSKLLRKWYDLMVKNSDDIAMIMTLESGKPLIESKGEVGYGNSYVEWFSEEARRINGDIIQSPVKTKRLLITKQPIGVAGLITPWNFPHAMIARKAAAALAAGCTCVVKPAADTPLTALAMAELADCAGIPKGVFNVITTARGSASAVGKLLCESPLVAGISFTGSTQVGRLLYSQCAGGIKRIALELGGNAPFIVFQSANIDEAVKGAMASKFRNCGQTCVSANRFFVHECVFDEFIEKFQKAIEDIKLGSPVEPSITAGPLINAAQINKVSGMVKDAVDKGACVKTGGKVATKLGNLFYQPTLLTDIKEDMLCYKEEVFGPIACVMPFKTEEEVLKIANDTPHGLAGYFYSEDVAQIFRVAKLLEVGMVGINDGMISTAEAAFGGIKQSGLGREGSSHGIEDFIYIKYMCLGNMS